MIHTSSAGTTDRARDRDCGHPRGVKASKKSINRAIKKDRKESALDGETQPSMMRGRQDGDSPELLCSTNTCYYTCNTEGTNSLDGADRDMATTVITVNTGEDAHGTIRIKNSVGKKLNPVTSHPLPAALSLAFSRRAFLGVGIPSTGISPQQPSHIVKCANRKLLPTLRGMNPSLMEANERAPPSLLHPHPSLSLCETRTPQF